MPNRKNKNKNRNRNKKNKKQINKNSMVYAKYEKEQEKEKKNIFKILIRIIIVIIFIGLTVFLFTYEGFNLNEIKVEGNQRVSEELILDASGFEKGKNVFLQKYINGKNKIKETGRISEVEVSYLFPDKILINVKEREEKYKISMIEGYYIIDSQGYILRKTDTSENLIQVSGLGNNLSDKKRIDEEYFSILEEINLISDTAKSFNFDALISSISKTDKYIEINFETLKKKANLETTKNIRGTMSMIKEILDREEGKEGEIFIRKEGPAYFREKV